MNTSIRDFEQSEAGSALTAALVDAVNTVAEAAANQILSHQQVMLLADVLPHGYPDQFSTKGARAVDDPNYGADFDLAKEMNEQIRVVRALRNMLTDEDGNIVKGTSPREAKELISTSGTMLQNLMKFHDKIMNTDRMRMIEQATIAAVKTMPVDQQEIFYSHLEKSLSKI